MIFRVCIAANTEQRLELEKKKTNDNVELIWVRNTSDLIQNSADLLIDCTFSGSQLPETHYPLLIHALENTLEELQPFGQVARFCAWNTFLQRDVWEIAIIGDHKWLKSVMHALGWNFLIVKDNPGLISPRIIAGIINEAYHALSEGISSKEEIDLAMKLGTSYPYGPFEWIDKIGSTQIHSLLEKLSKLNYFYNPVMNV